MRKILTAQPEDVPSSEADDSLEEEITSDADSASSVEALILTEKTGSKHNPVLLEAGAGEYDEKENISDKLKRKHPASEVEEHATEKKSKHPNITLLCLNCGSNFNPNRNKEGTCRYHPSETVLGELELNPTCDDIEDDEPSRETWANAFQWDCCETNYEDTDVEPCEQGRHRADGGEKTEYAERRERERRHKKCYGEK